MSLNGYIKRLDQLRDRLGTVHLELLEPKIKELENPELIDAISTLVRLSFNSGWDTLLIQEKMLEKYNVT